ncbi:MAG TPA: glycoside hydrolase family 3 N-terminal domain-containing protein [Kribbellaceae bacterium]|jgi:beta-N-acetylhexosaminidase
MGTTRAPAVRRAAATATRGRRLLVVLGLVLALTAGCNGEPAAGPATSAPSETTPASTPPPATSPTATATPAPSATPTPSPTPADCVSRTVAAMTTRQKAAQLVMTGIRAGGMTSSQRRALAGQHPGGILLLGSSGDAGAVRDVIAAAVAKAGRPNGVAPFVAADQEGGKVQRLQGDGFDRIPSAATQSTWSDAKLTDRAARWGRQLAAVGVNLDLAPVADVVPASVGDANQPIGALDRGYGDDPAEVGRHVSAFIRGMHAGGVATSVKHFPGLGRVRGNTDYSSGVVDGTTTRDDPLLGSFRAGIGAGTDLVMVATATYTRIDPDHRAVFSRTVIGGMLRGDLSFGGVVISDDLGAAAEVQAVSPGRRATRFVGAGGDIVITADASLTAVMVDALVARAPQLDLDRHVRRVLALKQQRGLMSCH